MPHSPLSRFTGVDWPAIRYAPFPSAVVVRPLLAPSSTVTVAPPRRRPETDRTLPVRLTVVGAGGGAGAADGGGGVVTDGGVVDADVGDVGLDESSPHPATTAAVVNKATRTGTCETRM